MIRSRAGIQPLSLFDKYAGGPGAAPPAPQNHRRPR